MKFLAVCLPIALSPAVVAQVNRDDMTPLEIAYTTTVSEDRRSLEIEMVVDQFARPTMHVAMPAWMPGAYFIGDFGEGVTDLEATGSDEESLEVTRMSKGTWSIATGEHSHVHVRYTVPASRRRRAPDPDEDQPVTGLRITGPATYLYVRGAKETPVTSTYELPDDWEIANGLLPTEDERVRAARDYDTFIDSPTTLGLFERRDFEVRGTPFTCVFFENEQRYDFDIDAFVEIVRRIVIDMGELFGSYPFPNYVFLFHLPGGGGLEHLNSTTIGLRADAQRRDPEAGASVTAHEFFHTWNVKRIRPETLGPFDYQRKNYTGNLWVSEGWTSYFGDLTLVRTGIITPDELLDILRRIIERELNKERRNEHSVYWASRNSWHRLDGEEGARVDYYGKGELLGALIDLKMRHETDGAKSLNDVMRFLNRWFAERDEGFAEDDVERACTAISNFDFGEFFARHVTGTMDPPIAEYLGYAGIEYSEEIIDCSFPFELRGKRIAGRPGPGDEDEEGPRPGETLIGIDGVDFKGRGHVPRQARRGRRCHAAPRALRGAARGRGHAGGRARDGADARVPHRRLGKGAPDPRAVAHLDGLSGRPPIRSGRSGRSRRTG